MSTNNVTKGIARLRLSRETALGEERNTGIAEGRLWALHLATYEKVRRLDQHMRETWDSYTMQEEDYPSLFDLDGIDERYIHGRSHTQFTVDARDQWFRGFIEGAREILKLADSD